jgi:two-component system cell cycle sensor histidine kinase/response regulator CckA
MARGVDCSRESGQPLSGESIPLSILQLEDNTLDAELASTLLDRSGLLLEMHRVETREDFSCALDTRRFDLILADFHLPQFNGLEALALARDKAPEVPFIFVSGMLGEEVAIDSLKTGATDYVLKMRMERLVPAVNRALAESRERAARRRFEAALAETENRFRKMADSAPVMIWTAGKDQAWDYCNKPWRDFTGLTLQQSCGSGWIAPIHSEDSFRVVEAWRGAFAEHRDFTMEFRLLRRDGEYRWVASRAVPRFDEGGGFAGFVGSYTDITDFKVTEERLRHTAKLESLGVLAGGIAHDFNNLLTGIMGNASLALEDLPAGSRVTPLVENILQASETAAGLTRQMLAYSGKGRFVVQEVDLSEEVRAILPLIDASVPRLVELKLELDADLPMVDADPVQIQQLAMNLVINAAEAIGSGSGSVLVSTGSCDLNVAATASLLSGFPAEPGAYVWLAVKDDGQGMDAATQARIFDPFFTTKFTGRGLGLAAVSGIVRGHKAGLALDSQPGAGTEFRAYFPISAGQKNREPEPFESQLKNLTILVVDDHGTVLRNAQAVLEKFGCRVLAARDGREAIELFAARAADIDVVLLDMTMPVLPGDVAFRSLRTIRPDVRVIATSGYDEEAANARFGGEIKGFLQKPYTATQLVEKILGAAAKGAAA